MLGPRLQATNHFDETAFHFLVELDDPAGKTEIAELLFAHSL